MFKNKISINTQNRQMLEQMLLLDLHQVIKTSKSPNNALDLLANKYDCHIPRYAFMDALTTLVQDDTFKNPYEYLDSLSPKQVLAKWGNVTVGQAMDLIKPSIVESQLKLEDRVRIPERAFEKLEMLQEMLQDDTLLSINGSPVLTTPFSEDMVKKYRDREGCLYSEKDILAKRSGTFTLYQIPNPTMLELMESPGDFLPASRIRTLLNRKRLREEAEDKAAESKKAKSQNSETDFQFDHICLPQNLFTIPFYSSQEVHETVPQEQNDQTISPKNNK